MCNTNNALILWIKDFNHYFFSGQLWKLIRHTEFTGRIENANGEWKYSDKTWSITIKEGKHKSDYITEEHSNKLLGLMGGETKMGTEVILENLDQASDTNYWFIHSINKDGWFKIMHLLRPLDGMLTAKDRQSLTIEGNKLRIHL